MKNSISVWFFYLTAVWGYSQTYSGKLSKVESDGLHLVLLHPEVRSALQANTAFFRISDQQKKEVSYVEYLPKNENSRQFMAWRIIDKSVVKDSVTSVVVTNEKAVTVNSLVVFISNTSLEKKYAVSGSNDGENWYGLTQNQGLSNLKSDQKKQVEKVIPIPVNNYKFLKIDFSDKNSLPVNVEKAGVYESEINDIKQIALDGFTTEIVQKDKTTQIIIRFKSPQDVSKIQFDIASDLYHRNAKILVNKSRKVKKRTENYQQELFSFLLNSKSNSSFSVSDFFEREFIIAIENEDNQPLEIQKVSLFQTPAYVLANLKAGEEYSVLVDTTLTKPNYDLLNFEPENTRTLNVVSIENFSTSANEEKPKAQLEFWQTQWFMWLSILIGVMVVGYFAFGLLKDVKREGE